jgi:hypothetical protein
VAISRAGDVIAEAGAVGTKHSRWGNDTPALPEETLINKK